MPLGQLPVSAAQGRANERGSGWQRVDILSIDQMSDAVMGAGLDAIQMNPGPFRGALAFHEQDGVTVSAGRIEGTVSLRGPLSEERVTVGVVLRGAPGSWHWMQEISTGSVGVFRPGDLHDAFYRPGSRYVAATLSLTELEMRAADEDLVLDEATLGGSRLHPRLMEPGRLQPLETSFAPLFDPVAGGGQGEVAAGAMLRALVIHLARPPPHIAGRCGTDNYTRIVARARAHIHAHLHEPIRIETLVKAARTSRRTLFRAFLDVMGEPPQNYIRRLRLNRIRHDLASDEEMRWTIVLVASQWGIDEPGRLSGSYRDIFGELPSQTVARRQVALSADWHDLHSDLERSAQTATPCVVSFCPA